MKMNMNTHWIRNAGALALLLAFSAPLRSAEMTRLDSQPGSKVRIEGTSSIHDWQTESKLIGGFMEVGPGFPTEPGQAVQPGKVDARVEVFIPVRSFKSVEKDGKPYSEKMDDRMYEAMMQPTAPRVLYRLEELVLKEPAKDAKSAYLFEAKGDLIVAGTTNKVTMPIQVTPLGDKKLKITGNTGLKMTSFKIHPPSPPLLGGIITTGDDVKIMFEWMVGQKPAASAAAPAK